MSEKNNNSNIKIFFLCLEFVFISLLCAILSHSLSWLDKEKSRTRDATSSSSPRQSTINLLSLSLTLSLYYLFASSFSSKCIEKQRKRLKYSRETESLFNWHGTKFTFHWIYIFIFISLFILHLLSWREMSNSGSNWFSRHW